MEEVDVSPALVHVYLEIPIHYPPAMARDNARVWFLLRAGRFYPLSLYGVIVAISPPVRACSAYLHDVFI